MVAFRLSNDVGRSGEARWATMAWRHSGCKAPSLPMYEQPLEAQQYIKGAPGKGVGSHEWTCRWCTCTNSATTSWELALCTASSQAFLAIRDELLGVQQQQWQQQQQQQTCEQQQQRWVQRGQHQQGGLIQISCTPASDA